MEKQTIVDTLKINYTEAGDSELPTLLLLHDWGASSAQWAGLIGYFQQDYHVLAPDFPGFGKSEEPEPTWGSAEYCVLTEHFLRAVKVKNPIVLAHSFGGRIGMMLAARGFAAKLILADSAGLKQRRSLTSRVKTAKKRFSLPGFGDKAEDGENQAPPTAVFLPPVLEAIADTLAKEDLHPYLERIKVPTLLVWGNRDTETPLADGEEMERVLKQKGVDTALIVLTGFGHRACLEAEKRFYRICKAFIEEGNEG